MSHRATRESASSSSALAIPARRSPIDLAEHGVETSVSIRAGANVVPRELLGIADPALGACDRRPARASDSAHRRRDVAQLGADGSRRRVCHARPGSIIGRPGVPVIGLDFLRLAKSGAIAIRPGIQSFTAGSAVVFADGREEFYDIVIFATGYRPALDYLDGLLTLDEGGQSRARRRPLDGSARPLLRRHAVRHSRHALQHLK